MRSWGWDPHDGISVLKRSYTKQLPLSLPCEDKARRPFTKQEESLHQELDWLVPWCWISILKNCEKFLLFQPHGLYCMSLWQFGLTNTVSLQRVSATYWSSVSISSLKLLLAFLYVGSSQGEHELMIIEGLDSNS